MCNKCKIDELTFAKNDWSIEDSASSIKARFRHRWFFIGKEKLFETRTCFTRFQTSYTDPTIGEDFPATDVTIDGLFNRHETMHDGMRGRPGESASESGKKVDRNLDSHRYFREGRHTLCSETARFNPALTHLLAAIIFELLLCPRLMIIDTISCSL